MPPSRNKNSLTNPGRSSEGSEHSTQPQSPYYKRFERPVHKSHGHDDTTPQMPDISTTFHTSAYIPNNIPWIPQYIPFNLMNTQAKYRNTLPNIAEHVKFPVASQFQGAQGFNINGQPRFTNIGMNTGNVITVNTYDRTHGLEKMEKFVSFAALHDSAEQDPTRRCHPGTRSNVLSQLGHWIDNPHTTHRICWLHGPAGAGKSAIAQTIAHVYKERGVAATFFFYRSDAERNNGNRLFPTLAWQLAFSIPVIKDFIVHALDKTPHLPRKDIETQFEQLVAYPFHPTNNIASQLPQPAPIVVIDGVDECSDEQLQRRILTVIGNAVKDDCVPLHFLICSRPEAWIEEVFDSFKDFILCIDLATLDGSYRDIEKYLVDQFAAIRSKRGLIPTWPGPEIIEEFVFKSSGYFVFAATVMRYISDEDYNPEDQLDIVRNLKPQGKMSPFALLDELYLEILKQQKDADFLKTFLALLVSRSSVDWGQSIFSSEEANLSEDDAILMNVSEQELRIKLRRMRSLLKFEPFIDVHHKSFLDFLQDPSRSGQHHVSKQGGQRRYLELTVDCVVRHVSMAIEQPNDHEKCCSSSKFRFIVKEYPPMILLPAKVWREALKPLLDLQDRLLNTLKPQQCSLFHVMRELLLHHAILQGKHHMLQSDINGIVTEHSTTLVTEVGQNVPENDLDQCLSVLLACFQKANSALTTDMVIIDRMSCLLAFDYAETAARVRSVAEAQKLVDIIDLLNNNKTFLTKCGRDAAHKAALLASETFARVPLLPRSVCLNGSIQHCDWLLKSIDADIEYLFQSIFISRILDRDHVLPVLSIYQRDQLEFVYGDVNEQNELVDKWLKRSRPNFITKVRVMLEIAKVIRYIHSMDDVVALNSDVIQSENFALDSNLRAKVMFRGYFAWQVREYLIYGHGDYLARYTPEDNTVAFANLFDEVCFDGDDDDENHPNHLVENARQLIERCHTEDPMRPTMENVVKEMETWSLI